MTNILLTVATTVVVLNIIFLFVPDGKYEKYIKITAGLIVIATFLNLITGIEISGDILHFDEIAEKHDTSELEAVMAEQVEENVKQKITQHLSERYDGKFEALDVKISDNAVTLVRIKIFDKRDEIIADLAAYCDINTDNVVVE